MSHAVNRVADQKRTPWLPDVVLRLRPVTVYAARGSSMHTGLRLGRCVSLVSYVAFACFLYVSLCKLVKQSSCYNHFFCMAVQSSLLMRGCVNHCTFVFSNFLPPLLNL